MPKPKPAMDKPRLRPPEKKKPGGLTAGLGSGFGKKLPEDDQRTLVGAAVFGIILIILVGAGYYFIVYAPYQQSLNNAKMQQISEVNTYFTGPLASSPQVSMLLAEIDAAVTPSQVLAVDVVGPATDAWRQYQNQQITNMTDPYGRVMISYTTPGSTTPSAMLYKVADAQTIVNESDASVLSNMVISTPDTVAIPVYISRLQAAGGLINVGDTVDIYQNVNTSSSNSTVESTNSDTPPVISGVTVLAILRQSTSGDYSSTLSSSSSDSVGNTSSSSSESASGQNEQELQAAASGNWNSADLSTLLTGYGYNLGNFEREANLGDIDDVNYLVVLEIPRQNAEWVIQNDNVAAGTSSLYLVVPTQNAPSWMVNVLRQVYG